MTTKKLEAIRGLFVDELVSATIAGQQPRTLRRLAALIVDCDARLERRANRRLEADAPSVERRQRMYAESAPKYGGG